MVQIKSKFIFLSRPKYHRSKCTEPWNYLTFKRAYCICALMQRSEFVHLHLSFFISNWENNFFFVTKMISEILWPLYGFRHASFTSKRHFLLAICVDTGEYWSMFSLTLWFQFNVRDVHQLFQATWFRHIKLFYFICDWAFISEQNRLTIIDKSHNRNN